MIIKELSSISPHVEDNSRSQRMPLVLLLIVIMFMSIISGIFAAFGNVIILIALLALYGIFFILAAPVVWIVWIIFWLIFLITGPSAYFLGFTQLQWLSVLMSGALFLPVILHLFQSKTNIAITSISSDFLLPLAFILFLMCSTLADRPQLSDFVYSSRHYLLMLSLIHI